MKKYYSNELGNKAIDSSIFMALPLTSMSSGVNLAKALINKLPSILRKNWSKWLLAYS